MPCKTMQTCAPSTPLLVLLVIMFCVQHLVDFFILQRGNVAGSDGLFAFERDTPKDMLFLGPSQEIWVLAR